MNGSHLFDLDAANLQAEKRYQAELCANRRSYNLSLLVELQKCFISGRFKEVILAHYPEMELAYYKSALNDIGSVESIARNLLVKLENASGEYIDFRLNHGNLFLKLKLEGDKIMGAVITRVDDIAHVRSSEVLCEEMSRLGILDPEIEIASW